MNTRFSLRQIIKTLLTRYCCRRTRTIRLHTTVFPSLPKPPGWAILFFTVHERLSLLANPFNSISKPFTHPSPTFLPLPKRLLPKRRRRQDAVMPLAQKHAIG